MDISKIVKDSPALNGRYAIISFYKSIDDNDHEGIDDELTAMRGLMQDSSCSLLSGDPVTRYRCRYRNPTLPRRDVTKGPADILTAYSAQHLLPICADLSAVYVLYQPRCIKIRSSWIAVQSAIARPFAYL